MIIRISDISSKIGMEMARLRREAGGKPLQFPAQDEWDIEVRSALAEVAVAVYLGIDPHLLLEQDHPHWDIWTPRGTIEVKAYTGHRTQRPYWAEQRLGAFQADFGVLTIPRSSWQTVQLCGWFPRGLLEQHGEVFTSEYGPERRRLSYHRLSRNWPEFRRYLLGEAMAEVAQEA